MANKEALNICGNDYHVLGLSDVKSGTNLGYYLNTMVYEDQEVKVPQQVSGGANARSRIY
jgi:hypothetical protein